MEVNTVAGNTRAVIGPGGAVRELLFQGEFTRLIFNNVSNWGELLEYLSSSGFPEYIVQQRTGGSADGSSHSGIVAYQSKADAMLVHQTLHTVYRQGNKLVNVRGFDERALGSKVMVWFVCCVYCYAGSKPRNMANISYSVWCVFLFVCEG